MIELELVDKNLRKNSPSPKHISFPKKNNLEEESSLTDSETVFTLTSISNDVTAIETSTPAKSDSNVESSSSPKPKCIKEELEESNKQVDNSISCDKSQPNGDGRNSDDSERKIITSCNNITSPMLNHTSTSSVSSISPSTGKM